MTTATKKGFSDWVEIFRSGTHTDSAGRKKTWTNGDLDEIVATHTADEGAALVVGHPKTDSPSFGWSHELKRTGDVLFAKFDKVHAAVESAAQSGAYRKRSAKIGRNSEGKLKLIHVGLLGAAPPAIEGLADVYAATDEGETFEFALNDGYWLSSLARTMRRFREFLVDKFDMETADRVAPTYEIEDAERRAAEAFADDTPRSIFNAPDPEPEMSQFTQAQVDAAVEAAVSKERAKTEAAESKATDLAAKTAKAEFNARLEKNKAFVSELIADADGKVRLLPAEAIGWAEALTFAEGLELESATFEFSASEGESTKQSLYEFMKASLGSREPRLKLGKQITDDDAKAVDTSDFSAIQKAAETYQQEEAKAGREVSISQAVGHVTKQQSRKAR